MSSCARFPMPRRMPLRASVLVGVAGLLVALGAPQAVAHPFGDPQRIEISAVPGEPDAVYTEFNFGGTDDITLLGLALEVLPPSRMMLDGAIIFEQADAEQLAASPQFSDYLTERLQVKAQGQLCSASIMDASALGAAMATEGVLVRHDCDGPAREVTVTARMLTDLHPAYRTMAEGPDRARHVYTVDAESETWSVPATDGEPGEDVPGGPWLFAALAAVGVAGAGCIAWVWTRRRRTRRA